MKVLASRARYAVCQSCVPERCVMPNSMLYGRVPIICLSGHGSRSAGGLSECADRQNIDSKGKKRISELPLVLTKCC